MSDCTVDGCDREIDGHGARGMCSRHYKRWLRNGHTGLILMRDAPLHERFLAKVERHGPDECWPWRGWRDADGYGGFWGGTRSERAHRVALELSGVIVPPEAVVMHHCDNPPCVNPNHLSVGTPSDNTADMYAKGRHPGKSAWTHCRRGHKYTNENTRLEEGRRRCLTCQRDYNREFQKARRRRLKAQAVGEMEEQG